MRANSIFSESLHFLKYSAREPLLKLDSGMFIVSIDIDVGSGKLGDVNKGMNDRNINDFFTEREIGIVEQHALPLFIRTFEEFEMPITFALRGQLLDNDSSFLNLLLASSIKHDIGAHGYSHKAFTSLSRDEADRELKMTSLAMRKSGITPGSFIFPKNLVEHLDLLVKYGYKCFRSAGGLRQDCMYIEKKGDLYDIHPSLYLDQRMCSTLLVKILDIAVKKKTSLHVWFHMWNLGTEIHMIQAAIDTTIEPLLKHAWKRRQEGMLRFETMLSATEEVKRESNYYEVHAEPARRSKVSRLS
jgi:hypothetical protein